MRQKPSDLHYQELPESALIWDETDHDWVIGYRTDFRRQKIITLVDAVLFDSTDETYTSPIFNVAGYRDLLLLINLDVTSTPTDIRIHLQFSDYGADWYKYMIGPFGDLRYEDSAGDLLESLNAPILAPWLRIYVVSSGCSSSATFKLSVKAVLNG